jgi:hypothetical protein
MVFLVVFNFPFFVNPVKIFLDREIKTSLVDSFVDLNWPQDRN